MVKGYKVFLSDWTCQPGGNFKQYSCPGMFEQDGKLEMCVNGIHFCKKLMDCFKHKQYYPGYKVAEVIAHGEVLERNGKYCTNKLEVVKEISPEEYLAIKKYTEALRKEIEQMMFEWWEKLTLMSEDTI